ncbi:MAG: rhodanese-like domain-containing protein [Gammaproteobacteria bacterium]|nr:rhodanese-like domain-containing protein [Gammaproteobacteria bacterium]
MAGTINIALVDLSARFNRLAPYRRRSIAVVCLSDKRSTQAIQLLRDAGFSDLLLLRGGMKAWHSTGLPVETVPIHTPTEGMSLRKHDA